MKSISLKPLLSLLMVCGVVVTTSGCENGPKTEYTISITNLSNGQPLSPPVAMLHNRNFNFWKLGETASEALELMAEGGDGSELLSLRRNNPQHQAESPVAPGETAVFSLQSRNKNLTYLSVAGMLVNTNDAFSGLNSVELSELQSGQTSVFYTHTYDAGTEFNSELSGTIPGPADSGEGFNADRDDITNVVTLHGGVVSADDNYAESTLSGEDKFDNPTLRIVVTAL